MRVKGGVVVKLRSGLRQVLCRDIIAKATVVNLGTPMATKAAMKKKSIFETSTFFFSAIFEMIDEMKVDPCTEGRYYSC